MSKNQDYIDQYEELAKDQMRRYGIPASVTLAQGILESASGQSQLAKNENNHFGIKATGSWIKAGGKYGLYTDDKPNEKFCSYTSVADSYEHHSKFLKNSTRYASCFNLQPDDYRGWANGLDKAGYATAGKYAPSLIKIIERNNLAQYDKQVLAELKAEGKTIGMDNVPQAEAKQAQESKDYSFPLRRDEFMLITSPFGMRQDPINGSKQQMHKGIDIRTKQDDVLATESKGKVASVNANANTAGGKSVEVEYERENGDKVKVSYLHLSSIDVKVGDEVSAGQKLGVSGNTGTRTTGEHLHFGVKQISSDGTSRDLDPASYLAEIAQKGNIQIQAMSNGQDLLAKYKSQDVNSNDKKEDQSIPQTPEDWMKKLLSSEDSGVNMAQGDPITEMAITMFTSLMALAIQIDGKSEQEKMQAATDAALTKRIDLSSLMPNMKSSALTIGDNGSATLEINNGKNVMHHELSNGELSRLSSVLNATDLSDDVKKQKIARMVGSIFASHQVSQNYEQQASQSESQVETIRR